MNVELIALNRMAFGLRPGDLEAFRALGNTDDARLSAYIEQQLQPSNILDTECDNKLTLAGLTTLGKSLTQLWAEHYVDNKKDYSFRIAPITDTRKATILKAVYSKRQLQEVLADFWHNHFNVFGWEGYAQHVWPHYDRDCLRANMFGNFRQMLEAVATSPAMLYYLDNYRNSRGGPNENWARELIELHTLGAENYLGVKPQNEVQGYASGSPIGYVDGDVYEATRCFTGWRVNDSTYEKDVTNTGTFLFYEPWHDRFQKIVLGKNLPPDQSQLKDGRDVLDLLAAHPGTGRFVCRKLCRRLISDNPPDRVVNEAAALFTAQKDAPDQLRQVYRLILKSPEFSQTWGDKMKRPFDFAMSMLRATNTDITFQDDGFFWNYDALGQSMFARRPPDGYPDTKEAWTNTTSILQRWRLTAAVIEGNIKGFNAKIVEQTLANAVTPNQLADFWIERILGHAMTRPDDRAEIVRLIAQGKGNDTALTTAQIAERIPRAVELVLMCPDFQLK